MKEATQHFGRGTESAHRSRRLPPSMAEVLAYVFSGAEADAGLKSIGLSVGTELGLRAGGDAKPKGERDHYFAPMGGCEDDQTFVHLFAQERYVLRRELQALKSRGEQAIRRKDAARRALMSIQFLPGGSRMITLLYLYYGPLRLNDERRSVFGDLAPIVEFTPLVADRRESMVERLSTERVEQAEGEARRAEEKVRRTVEALIAKGRGQARVSAAPAADVSAASIRSGAESEVTRSVALRDILRSWEQVDKKQGAEKLVAKARRSTTIATLKSQADHVLAKAEDAYRVAFAEAMR